MLRGAVIRLSEAHQEAGAWSMADTLQNHGKKDWRCEAASVNRSPRAQETWSDVGRNSDVRVAACRGQRCKPARTVGQPSAAARAIPCGPGGATPPRTDRGGARQKSFLLSVQYCTGITGKKTPGPVKDRSKTLLTGHTRIRERFVTEQATYTLAAV